MAVNHHLRAALDLVGDAVIVVEGAPLHGQGPRIVYANATMAEATGVAVDRLCGVSLGDLLGAEHSLLFFAAMQNMTGKAECAAPLQRVGAEPVGCSWTLAPMAGPQGEALNYILCASPETAPVPLEAPIATAPEPEKQALPELGSYDEDVVETIRETARHLAHEFNNALTGVLPQLELLMLNAPADTAQHENLKIANHSAMRARDLAGDFLVCFRPRPIKREVCDLRPLLERTVRLATCSQNVETSVELAPDLELVDVDQSQLERVVFNLVRNACQAMRNGGRLRLRAANELIDATHVSGLPAGPSIHVEVRDWGPGIAEEHLPHLFNSRFTTKEDGNGCGLPICNQIIEEHGGAILVRTKVNVGTSFMIYLPSAGAAPVAPLAPTRPRDVTTPVPAPQEPLIIESAPAPAPVASEPEAESGDGYSILVVDDEDNVRTTITQCGKHFGLDVSAVATSEEALHLFKNRIQAQRPFDAVVLDINLRGGHNGYETFDMLRRVQADAAIVATSGQHSEEDILRYEDMGFAGFLPKPFTVVVFGEVMQSVLEPDA
jgi:signal transduction histidine kinase